MLHEIRPVTFRSDRGVERNDRLRMCESLYGAVKKEMQLMLKRRHYKRLEVAGRFARPTIAMTGRAAALEPCQCHPC